MQRVSIGRIVLALVAWFALGVFYTMPFALFIAFMREHVSWHPFVAALCGLVISGPVAIVHLQLSDASTKENNLLWFLNPTAIRPVITPKQLQPGDWR